MPDDRAAQMARLQDELDALSASRLDAFRRENNYHPVMGEGDLHAAILFVGEAPGKKEAETGRPFVGASGRILDELLASVGISRQEVYITSVVKDRPPKNRDPRPDEIDVYAPFLERQLAIIRPRVIATLGRFAMEFIFRHYAMPQLGQSISQIHGQTFTVDAPHGQLVHVPLYHPAVALYGKRKEILFEDFQALRPFMDERDD